MITIVIRRRKEGRKKMPEAVADFIDRTKAENFLIK